jgi:hypothetical protein
MSFRPARFTDIHRSGPPTTGNGSEWVIPIPVQPPDEWLQFFKTETDDTSLAAQWVLTVQNVQLRFRSSPDDVPHHVQSVDRWIARANEQYRSWLMEAHRKGEERSRGEQTEADRVRGLNERFRGL